MLALFRPGTVLLLIASALSACGAPEAESPPMPCDGCELALKCTFSSAGDDILSGEAFLYVLQDPASGAYGVVHGLASEDDALAAPGLGARGGLPVLAAERTASLLEWRERAGGALVTNWIAEWSRAVVGERYLAFGGSHLNDEAYPPCVAHEAMTRG